MDRQLLGRSDGAQHFIESAELIPVPVQVRIESAVPRAIHVRDWLERKFNGEIRCRILVVRARDLFLSYLENTLAVDLAIPRHTAKCVCMGWIVWLSSEGPA